MVTESNRQFLQDSQRHRRLSISPCSHIQFSPNEKFLQWMIALYGEGDELRKTISEVRKENLQLRGLLEVHGISFASKDQKLSNINIPSGFTSEAEEFATTHGSSSSLLESQTSSQDMSNANIQKTDGSPVSSSTAESCYSYNLRRSDDMAPPDITAAVPEPTHWLEGDGLSIVSKPWCDKTQVSLQTECTSEAGKYKSKSAGPSYRSKFFSGWGINFCSSSMNPRISLKRSESSSSGRLGYCHRNDESSKRVVYPSKVGTHLLTKNNDKLHVDACDLHGSTPEVKVTRQ